LSELLLIYEPPCYIFLLLKTHEFSFTANS